MVSRGKPDIAAASRPGCPDCGHHGKWRLALAVGVIGIAGCRATDGGGAPLPPSPPVIPLELDEYSFNHDQPMPTGRVVFELLNTGTVHHQLRLFPLTEDIPPIDEQLRSSERRIVEAVASVPILAPGERATVAVDLLPAQRYAIVCFIRDADGVVHAEKGMNAEFRAP